MITFVSALDQSFGIWHNFGVSSDNGESTPSIQTESKLFLCKKLIQIIEL